MVLKQIILAALISFAVYTDVDFTNLLVDSVLVTTFLFMVVALIHIIVLISYYTSQIKEVAING